MKAYSYDHERRGRSGAGDWAYPDLVDTSSARCTITRVGDLFNRGAL